MSGKGAAGQPGLADLLGADPSQLMSFLQSTLSEVRVELGFQGGHRCRCTI